MRERNTSGISAKANWYEPGKHKHRKKMKILYMLIFNKLDHCEKILSK